MSLGTRRERTRLIASTRGSPPGCALVDLRLSRGQARIPGWRAITRSRKLLAHGQQKKLGLCHRLCYSQAQYEQRTGAASKANVVRGHMHCVVTLRRGCIREGNSHQWPHPQRPPRSMKVRKHREGGVKVTLTGTGTQVRGSYAGTTAERRTQQVQACRQNAGPENREKRRTSGLCVTTRLWLHGRKWDPSGGIDC